MFARGQHCWALRRSALNSVSPVLQGGASLLCHAGYTQGSATHFSCSKKHESFAVYTTHTLSRYTHSRCRS